MADTGLHIYDRVSPDEWSRQMRLVIDHAKTPADFDTVDALIREALDPLPFREKWRMLLQMRVDSIIGRVTYRIARWRQRGR